MRRKRKGEMEMRSGRMTKAAVTLTNWTTTIRVQIFSTI